MILPSRVLNSTFLCGVLFMPPTIREFVSSVREYFTRRVLADLRCKNQAVLFKLKLPSAVLQKVNGIEFIQM